MIDRFESQQLMELVEGYLGGGQEFEGIAASIAELPDSAIPMRRSSAEELFDVYRVRTGASWADAPTYHGAEHFLAQLESVEVVRLWVLTAGTTSWVVQFDERVSEVRSILRVDRPSTMSSKPLIPPTD